MNTAPANTRISTKPNEPELVINDRPRVQEDDLDVEDDEDHRDEVEPHREPLGGSLSGTIPHSYGATFASVGLRFGASIIEATSDNAAKRNPRTSITKIGR